MEKLKLTPKVREILERFVGTGTKKARAIKRARVLLLLDEDYSNEDVSEITDVHRQSIWRIKKRFVEEGLDYILNEKPRPGQPRKYQEREEAEIIAMACTAPPKGRERWTVRLLTEYLKRRKGFETLNRETVRLVLKKAGLNLGRRGRGASPR
jgi:transposase